MKIRGRYRLKLKNIRKLICALAMALALLYPRSVEPENDPEISRIEHVQHELKKLALESDCLFSGLIAVCDDLYLATKTVYLNNPVKVRKTAKTPLAERRKLAKQKALERMRAHYQSDKNISWREAERLTQAEMWREFRDLGLAHTENNFHKLRFG